MSWLHQEHPRREVLTAASAPHYYLDRSAIDTGYRAAPQVFYFVPQRTWYLVYQTGNASYSTNTAAVPFACVDMGNPTGTVSARTLFIHGDRDPICQYSSARQAYQELPAPKAFLTHRGQGHDEYVWNNGATYPQTRATFVDWMRWSLYDDSAARDRLAADAASNGTAWEAVLS